MMLKKRNKIELPKPILSVDGTNLEIKTADIVECRAHWEDTRVVIDYLRDFYLYKKMTDLIKHQFSCDVVMRWEA